MNDLENRLRAEADASPSPALVEEFVRRAGGAGLIDVAYALVPSPLGELVAAVTRRGLLMLSYEEGRHDALLESLARGASPRILHVPERLDPVRRQLDEYFAGKRRDFDIPIDWSLTRGFGRKVLRATARIPFGKVATYSEVARRAGSPRAYRAAGNALSANPIPIVVPCHRVVRTGGGLGGYTGGLDKKRRLLAIEGDPL